MLFLLGALPIEVAPFNFGETSESGGADFVAKQVAGVEPPLEWVGEGTNSITFDGTIFPEALGGLDGIDVLNQMRVSGRPQYLMRGDGRAMGWWVIRSNKAQSSRLDAQGVGKVIDVWVSAQRSGPPREKDFFSVMQGLAQIGIGR